MIKALRARSRGLALLKNGGKMLRPMLEADERALARGRMASRVCGCGAQLIEAGESLLSCPGCGCHADAWLVLGEDGRTIAAADDREVLHSATFAHGLTALGCCFAGAS